MAIHSLRLSHSVKTRDCSICGDRISKKDPYAVRNASVIDHRGMRLYGFFASHPECEWVAEGLRAGIVCDGELSFPGFAPNLVMGRDLRKLRELEGWEDLTPEQVSRIVGWIERKKERDEPSFELRYYNSRTRERTAFVIKLADLKVDEGCVVRLKAG